MGTPEWTQARIARLEELWISGVPVSKIGRELKLSVSAVGHKAARIGLPARASPIRPEQPDSPGAARRHIRKPQCAALAPFAPPAALSAPPALPPRLPAGRGCQWPLWGAGRAPVPAPYCGKPLRDVMTPYCEEHARRAYG